MTGTAIDQALTDQMVEKSVSECAETYFAGDNRKLKQAIFKGQCEYCKCISNRLTKHICDYLGQVDKTIKAVYKYYPVLNPDEQGEFQEHYYGINLIAWVERKSAALSTLAESLEKGLSVSQLKLGCVKANPSCFTLDIIMVDTTDIQEQRGFGLMVAESINLHSEVVWKRAQAERVITEKTPESGHAKYSLPESFDPDLIPESRLLEHALTMERMPQEDRVFFEPHLMELKVTLIRRIISDQLPYINIAKRWFTIADLENIFKHRIGFGKIGGKSAGMLLAARIINEAADEDVKAAVQIPESYFLGSDLMYIFISMNGLMYWNDQKHKPENQIRAEYPRIQKEFLAGSFPPEVLVELKDLLVKIGKQPIIVRSSSQLEDNFGTSFAGKYNSYFCPNQGTLEENLIGLTRAIAQTYSSAFNPEAILYRVSKGLQDYDERMAILLQVVQGEKVDKYFFPQAAGVAFSHNMYRWDPQIRRDDGFIRLVWGLGTRAVDRLGDDYPRLVALSHPTLQPDDSPEAIRYYSQQYIDLIDLEENSLKTLPIHDVITPDYDPINLIIQLEQDGVITSPYMRVKWIEIPHIAITFHEFLRRTQFASMMSRILKLIEKHYHAAVDMEFTVQILNPNATMPKIKISLLQCRPQSRLKDISPAYVPKDLETLPDEEILFSTRFMVPLGYLANVQQIIFVKPEEYFALGSELERGQIGQTVGRLNTALKEKTFICVGPGRWGSTNRSLGVYVSYSDIHRCGALVELSGKGIGLAPEPSLGTHFFQDLMEAQIYPLSISLDEAETRFNRDIFYNTPNIIQNYLDVDDKIANCVRLIDIGQYRSEHHIEIVMDDEKRLAVAFFVHN